MSRRHWTTLIGLLLAVAIFILTREAGLPAGQSWTAAVTTLCAAWWISEALPLPATSLVPLAVFPLVGVLTERQTAAAYGHPVIFLFMGGFMLSKAAERFGAHHRIAQMMLGQVGRPSGRQVVLALMLATAFISMWINNTATTLMMLPVAMAVLDRDTSGKLAVPLLLGIAYSASIGGIVTPIGTAPNGIFLAVYRDVTEHSVPFHQWMMMAAPVSAAMLLAAWGVLTWRLGDVGPVELAKGERWSPAQRRTLAVFAATATAWVTREVPFGGWSALLEGAEPGAGMIEVGDTTVAVAAVVAMFLIPSGQREGERLLDWPTAASIPWGVLLLFGGGIAIAAAFDASGLSKVIGHGLTGIQEWPILATLAVLSLAVTFLSELTSNTATANILMPILAAAAVANGMDPILLMVPATLANSLAFMMPVGTPPNAIVFSTGQLRIIHMVRYGFVLNLTSALIVTLASWKLLPVVFRLTAGG
jgi:sodium-dependent dicarboxylate transporter 2/3/5